RSRERVGLRIWEDQRLIRVSVPIAGEIHARLRRSESAFTTRGEGHSTNTDLRISVGLDDGERAKHRLAHRRVRGGRWACDGNGHEHAERRTGPRCPD